MTPWIDGLLDLILPRTCPVCGRVMVAGEELMCLHCRMDLPLVTTDLHDRLMTLHAPIERVAAYFYYQREEPHARLIQQAKYDGKPHLGERLMAEYTRTLLPTGFFSGMDAIAAVPLHWRKLIARGYNQSFRMARGVSSVTGIPLVDPLRAARHGSQTRLTATQRLANARGTYTASHATLTGITHLLLVDDIITTGATLTACAEAIHAASPSTRISALSLAATLLA